MVDTPVAAVLAADDVASYLRRHPQFLAAYPDLALTLQMPRQHGEVASLASWQLQSLRERNGAQESRLQELIDNAQRNEVLMLQVHALTLALMRAPGLAQVLEVAVQMVSDGLGVDHVRLLLFLEAPDLPAMPWLHLEPRGPAAVPMFATLLETGQPHCGRLTDAQAHFLFGGQERMPGSAALVPLGDLGLLALGSDDANHFHPGMGLTFITLLAEALVAAISRFPADTPP